MTRVEILMVLRAYQAHPTCWTEIINDIKSNVHNLSEEARRLYENATNKQLRDRISTKFGKSLQETATP